jgi:hypothetical protein
VGNLEVSDEAVDVRSGSTQREQYDSHQYDSAPRTTPVYHEPQQTEPRRRESKQENDSESDRYERQREEREIRAEEQRAERERRRQEAADERERKREEAAAKKDQIRRDKKLTAAIAEAERIRRRQEAEERGTTAADFREMARKNKNNKPYVPQEPLTPKTIVKKVGDVAGGVLIATKKEIVSDGHGRSGRRASLAYRRANRAYNSEARRMGSQVATPAKLSSKMLFGVNNTPVRSRAKGMNQFSGVTDPLSNFTSKTLLGSRVVRQDTVMEGMGRRVVQNQYAPKKKGDPLKAFSKMIGGF